ncbi:alanine/ornithine racemase family PLP-dependent enzyme [Actinospongicola halichondriae]|uniref:alanine/ornithine racemase family PLP-dependent enzyme n=1 Tax=Actinospongicola halichondriae TaxID=3236844 RepID=UPI003D3A4D9A
MTGARVGIDLSRVASNAADLVELLGRSGVSVTGVTKAVLGHPAYAETLVDAGVARLGDSRVENIERMRCAGVTATTMLLRSPMISQVERVVHCADISMNTEPAVLHALSDAAGVAAKKHEVVLMVELGDLREGIGRADLAAVVEETLTLPHIALVGIGTNLACRSGTVPDDRNMAELSTTADDVETEFGITLDIVSGGNSANLDWLASTDDVGRVNDLRLGEAILLGCEPLHRRPLPGLHLDAFTISGEVVESKRKPTLPWGSVAQAAFGTPSPPADRGEIWQTIVALGRQDIDPDGLTPPAGTTVLAASSDHLVLETPRRVPPGETIAFRPDYAALLRAMTSPFATQEIRPRRSA